MNSTKGFFSLVLTALLFITTMTTGSGQVADGKIPVVKVSDQPLHSGRINPMIYGGFIELLDDLVPGMRAEMLNDRNFEGVEKAAWWCYYTGKPNFCDHEWDRPATWSYDTIAPFNGARSARLNARKSESAVLAQSMLAVKKGMKYLFEGYFKSDAPNLQPTVRLEFLNPDGTRMILGSAKLSRLTNGWTKQKCEIISSGTTDQAVFKLEVRGSGSLWVDKISLMPEDNLKGWRADVTKAIKDARPSVIRWGGSVVDPGGYKWKNGIGNPDLRVPFHNSPWGRIDPNDVGLDEFLQFCELVDAEPLVCISFMDGPESAKDMVNYCNAGPDTGWGMKRANNGHPEPYGVKYWQIGNELGDEEYITASTAYCRAIKEADPKAKILSSFPTSELLAASGKYLDYVCPHHYSPDLEGHAADFSEIARDIRNASLDHEVKIGVTEWNITAGWWGLGRGKLMMLSTGLYTGRYLNLLHRYSDVVELACRSNMTNSYGSGMIQTNPEGLYLTAAYYVMELYAEHTKPIPVRLEGAPEGLDISACSSDDKTRVCIFAVNTTDQPVPIRLDLTDYGQGFQPAGGEVFCDTQDRRQPDLMNHFDAPDRIRTIGLSLSENGLTLPALSIVAIECAKR
ncbi:MAG: alpha-L-arabinofuranosidase C-terminal domain-containing protein [Bacteroidota bacterium]